MGVFGSLTLVNCVFRNHYATSLGGPAVRIGTGAFPGDPSTIRACLFEGNEGSYTGAIWIDKRQALIEGCTFVRNKGVSSGIIHQSGGSLEIRNSIVAFSDGGSPVACSSSGTVSVSCCNSFGNPGGDWVGCVAGQEGVNGNISADPLFCDLAGGDYTLRKDSPCLPPQSGDCGQIGAFGVGCGSVHVEPSSWGSIKALYR